MKKAAYIVLFLFVTVKGFSQNQEQEVHTVVDEMPEFIGGQPKLMTFLQENIVYPVDARKAGAQGKVFIKFVVDEFGKVRNITVLKSSGNKLIDDEAVRVVSIMPTWQPGKLKGKAVPTYFNLPINFKL